MNATSIGFRSPTARELGAEFLGWLQERLDLQGLYADPDLQPQVFGELHRA